jgi:hypothetical protein
MRTRRGGEDDNDHKLSLSFVFHRSDKGQKKKHKANDFVLSFSSLRGARGGGSKVDDDLCDRRRFLFFIKVTIEKK